MRDVEGKEVTFPATVLHHDPIPDGGYVILKGDQWQRCIQCVIGKITTSGAVRWRGRTKHNRGAQRRGCAEWARGSFESNESDDKHYDHRGEVRSVSIR